MKTIFILLALALPSCAATFQNKFTTNANPESVPGVSASFFAGATDVSVLGIRGGSTDETALIQAALSRGIPLYFPPTNYTTSGGLVATNNTQIYGYNAEWRLLNNSDSFLLSDGSCTNVQVFGLTGNGTNFLAVSGRAWVTNRIGFLINTARKNRFTDVTAYGFDQGFYIWGDSTSSTSYRGPRSTLENPVAYSNSIAMNIDSTGVSALAEYMNISGVDLFNNYCGFKTTGANVQLFNGKILNNKFGFAATGGQAWNNSHGIFVGMIINHNELLSMTNINTTGWLISGCQMLVSDHFYLSACNAVQMVGNNLDIDYLWNLGTITTANALTANSYRGTMLFGSGPGGNFVLVDTASKPLSRWGNFSLTIAGDGDGLGTIQNTTTNYFSGNGFGITNVRPRLGTNGVGTITPDITVNITNQDGSVYSVAAQRIVP